MAERAEPTPPAPEPARDAASSAAPTSLGEFAALGGSASEDVVKRLNERVGNQATTSWLSRAAPARNAPPPAAEEPETQEERPT